MNFHSKSLRLCDLAEVFAGDIWVHVVEKLQSPVLVL